MKCGIGIEKWSDGALFKGEYKDDKKHGQGKLQLADGSKYIGEFQNGVI